jgi:hypothetical protein
VSLLALPLGLAALVPVMVGPLPMHQGPAALTAALCNGGTITIPLGPRKAPAEDRGCHPKGCHAGTCRDDKTAKLISRKDA